MTTQTNRPLRGDSPQIRGTASTQTSISVKKHDISLVCDYTTLETGATPTFWEVALKVVNYILRLFGINSPWDNNTRYDLPIRSSSFDPHKVQANITQLRDNLPCDPTIREEDSDPKHVATGAGDTYPSSLYGVQRKVSKVSRGAIGKPIAIDQLDVGTKLQHYYDAKSQLTDEEQSDYAKLIFHELSPPLNSSTSALLAPHVQKGLTFSDLASHLHGIPYTEQLDYCYEYFKTAPKSQLGPSFIVFIEKGLMRCLSGEQAFSQGEKDKAISGLKKHSVLTNYLIDKHRSPKILALYERIVPDIHSEFLKRRSTSIIATLMKGSSTSNIDFLDYISSIDKKILSQIFIRFTLNTSSSVDPKSHEICQLIYDKAEKLLDKTECAQMLGSFVLNNLSEESSLFSRSCLEGDHELCRSVNKCTAVLRTEKELTHFLSFIRYGMYHDGIGVFQEDYSLFMFGFLLDFLMLNPNQDNVELVFEQHLCLGISVSYLFSMLFHQKPATTPDQYIAHISLTLRFLECHGGPTLFGHHNGPGWRNKIAHNIQNLVAMDLTEKQISSFKGIFLNNKELCTKALHYGAYYAKIISPEKYGKMQKLFILWDSEIDAIKAQKIFKLVIEKDPSERGLQIIKDSAEALIRRSSSPEKIRFSYLSEIKTNFETVEQHKIYVKYIKFISQFFSPSSRAEAVRSILNTSLRSLYLLNGSRDAREYVQSVVVEEGLRVNALTRPIVDTVEARERELQALLRDTGDEFKLYALLIESVWAGNAKKEIKDWAMARFESLPKKIQTATINQLKPDYFWANPELSTVYTELVLKYSDKPGNKLKEFYIRNWSIHLSKEDFKWTDESFRKLPSSIRGFIIRVVDVNLLILNLPLSLVFEYVNENCGYGIQKHVELFSVLWSSTSNHRHYDFATEMFESYPTDLKQQIARKINRQDLMHSFQSVELYRSFIELYYENKPTHYANLFAKLWSKKSLLQLEEWAHERLNTLDESTQKEILVYITLHYKDIWTDWCTSGEVSMRKLFRAMSASVKYDIGFLRTTDVKLFASALFRSFNKEPATLISGDTSKFDLSLCNYRPFNAMEARLSIICYEGQKCFSYERFVEMLREIQSLDYHKDDIDLDWPHLRGDEGIATLSSSSTWKESLYYLTTSEDMGPEERELALSNFEACDLTEKNVDFAFMYILFIMRGKKPSLDIREEGKVSIYEDTQLLARKLATIMKRRVLKSSIRLEEQSVVMKALDILTVPNLGERFTLIQHRQSTRDRLLGS